MNFDYPDKKPEVLFLPAPHGLLLTTFLQLQGLIPEAVIPTIFDRLMLLMSLLLDIWELFMFLWTFSLRLPKLPYIPLHSELWKISAAFQPITAWKGQFNSIASGHSLHFDKNSTQWIKHLFIYLLYFL